MAFLAAVAQFLVLAHTVQQYTHCCDLVQSRLRNSHKELCPIHYLKHGRYELRLRTYLELHNSLRILDCS